MAKPRKILRIPVGSIRAYERNPRLHPDDQMRHLSESMQRFGFIVPLLVTADNELVCGHGRLAAAKQAWSSGFDIPGTTREVVPAIRASGMTPAEIRAYRIADNKLAQMSHFDDAALNDALRELCGADGFGAGALGFDESELALLLGAAERADPNVLGTSPEPEAPETLASFSCLMSAESHDRMRAQLTRIRERLSLPNDGAALVAACTRYMAQ